MGNSLSKVGAVTQAPTQQPVQSPTQAPVQAEPPGPGRPGGFWPPAYGRRLDALQRPRESHNAWQAAWNQQGPALAGSVESVGQLKDVLRPHLRHPRHG